MTRQSPWIDQTPHQDDTNQDIASSLLAIESIHADYRKKFIKGVSDCVLAKTNAIVKNPSIATSIFRIPDSIQISIEVPFNELGRFFENNTDEFNPPILNKDEILALVKEALKQDWYTVSVEFWDGWPHGEVSGFTINLQKNINTK
jgi:hypothetical protein